MGAAPAVDCSAAPEAAEGDAPLGRTDPVLAGEPDTDAAAEAPTEPVDMETMPEPAVGVASVSFSVPAVIVRGKSFM